jgi:hypothetical protein
VHTVLLQPAQVWSYAASGLPPTSFTNFEAWCAAHAGQSVRVVLASALTHQLVADPSLPLHDSEAVLAWARHQFVHYHGAPALHWPIAPWCHGPQRGAIALHALELEPLLQSASNHRVRIQAIEPWWSVALRTATRRAPLLAGAEPAELWLLEGVQLTRLRCAGYRVHGIEQRWLNAPDESSLAQLIAQLSAVHNPLWVLGCGLASGAANGLGAAQVLGALQAAWPEPEWVLA